jgi:hypothetical protein
MAQTGPVVDVGCDFAGVVCAGVQAGFLAWPDNGRLLEESRFVLLIHFHIFSQQVVDAGLVTWPMAAEPLQNIAEINILVSHRFQPLPISVRSLFHNIQLPANDLHHMIPGRPGVPGAGD